ncbi:transcriptional regulator [Pokkaliibacter plantistimulans]|uniref:Transcriptional regulator n=2 Tax=Pseudomonadota TaxID=1224 RepID=A0A2S5KKX5_9PROT|nr:transcriptional regulator [Pokkaliibacter plantistimulans]
MNGEEREQLLIELVKRLALGTITEGELLKKLRIEVLGYNQEKYAKLTGISRRVLTSIESGEEGLSMATLNKAFKPFGLKMGLVPTNLHILKQAIQDLDESTS